MESSLTWQEFKQRPLAEKMAFFAKSGRMHDVLYSQQFNRDMLDEIYTLTNNARLISKNQAGREWLGNLLSHYKAMLYFVQPSTRTFLSFATAARALGLSFFDVRSVETSSEVKGESFSDTIRTFSSYFDLIIMRHHAYGYAEKAAFVLNTSPRPIPLINAGSSQDQHPTQALLDIYTLRKSFEKNGGLDNKTIMMVGDLRRGRTVRSLCYLLHHFNGVKVILASPPHFSMNNDVLDFLKEHGIPTLETTDMNAHIHEADAVYMTRIQDEYDELNLKKATQELYASFKLQPQHLKQMKKNAVIMHPLPRRDEIHPAIDNDPRAKYWRQVRNGMWTRVALIANCFRLNDSIRQESLKYAKT